MEDTSLTCWILVLVVRIMICLSSVQGADNPPRFREHLTLTRVGVVKDTQTFSCKIKGYPKPFLTWYYNGVVLEQNKRIKITKYTLQISNLELPDTGIYSCKAENRAGVLWGNFTLYVIENEGPPEFLPELNLVEYLARAPATSVTFDCEAKGYPYPTTTFLKNGLPLAKNKDRFDVNGFKLRITGLKLEDQGNYTCIVKNEYGAVNWTTTLEVQRATPPRFRECRKLTRVGVVRDTHKFSCKTKGSPKPFVIWYHNGVVLEQNERMKITKYELQISNLKLSDTGMYSCKAENKAGVLWGNFTLHVIENEDPPEFLANLNLVEYLARAATTSVTFDCEARGYPYPTITWQKNGLPVTEKNDRFDMNGFKLKITSLKLEDQGNYTCIVKNEYGAINWTTKLEVQLRVAIAPLMENVDNQTAIVGDNVTFTCTIIMSDSQPLLQWLGHFKKNGSFVNERGEPYVAILQTSGGFDKTIDEPQHLVLRNVSQEDEGWYTCLVANTVGMNYRSAYLSVLNGKKVS